MSATNTIVIREATEADTPAITRLAILDSREPLTGPALLVEVGGVPRAALDLDDGSVAADPFAPTAQLVGLLREHARHRRPGRSGLRDRLATIAHPVAARMA